MDSLIAQRIAEYCDKKYGTVEDKPNSTTHISKKNKILTDSTDLQINNKLKMPKKINKTNSKLDKIEPCSSSNTTIDGFKIVNDILPDDSDISDAFESEEDVFVPSAKKRLMNNKWTVESMESSDVVIENEESNNQLSVKEDDLNTHGNEVQYTDDGFKIASEIPSDDSDVDDAFESDEDFNDVETVVNPVPIVKKNKTALLKIMEDFGIDPEAIRKKKADQVRLQNQKSTSKQMKRMEGIEIIDHSQRRGKRKVIIPEKKDDEEEDDKTVVEPRIELMDEKAFKKARHEVFKYGMSGFHKEKKQATRLALLISLGAKPPKNKAVNYKDLQIQLKFDKLKKKEDKETLLKQGLKVKEQVKKTKRDNNDIRGFGTQSGRFKEGRRFVSKSELSNIKRSR